MPSFGFCFGDIVIVDEDCIGVVVKVWNDHTYDVYVRAYNGIRTYKERYISRYMVRHKILSDEEMQLQLEMMIG